MYLVLAPAQSCRAKAACPLALGWLVKVGGAKSVLMFPSQADRRQTHLTQGYTPPGVHTALATPPLHHTTPGLQHTKMATLIHRPIYKALKLLKQYLIFLEFNLNFLN